MIKLVILLLSLLILFPDLSSSYTLQFKTKKLSSLSSSPDSQHLLTLDSNSFNILTEAPRNYSIIVLLTALDPKFGCSHCLSFQSQYQRVAYSWSIHRNLHSHPLYFAYLDFSLGQTVFQSLKLTSAPNVYFYPATHGNYTLPSLHNNAQFIEYEVARKGLDGALLTDWVGQQIKDKFIFTQPPDYTKHIILAIIGIIVIIARQYVTPILRLTLFNRKLYALISLFGILLLTNGYMWNAIRQPPYIIVDQSNTVQYIGAGMQQQYGIETQISALLHGTASFTIVGLIIAIPKIKSLWLQRLTTILLIIILMFAYSMIMRLFNIKSPGYLQRLF